MVNRVLVMLALGGAEEAAYDPAVSQTNKQ
jgi:hypothetical protein